VWRFDRRRLLKLFLKLGGDLPTGSRRSRLARQRVVWEGVLLAGGSRSRQSGGRAGQFRCARPAGEVITGPKACGQQHHCHGTFQQQAARVGNLRFDRRRASDSRQRVTTPGRIKAADDDLDVDALGDLELHGLRSVMRLILCSVAQISANGGGFEIRVVD
jgi:hypothetical protein